MGVEWLETVFLGAFAFGLLFCVATYLLGLGHVGFGHADAAGGHGPSLGAGHGGGMHVAHSANGAPVGNGAQAAPAGHGGNGGHDGPVAGRVSPWNLTALTAFVAWFGGFGYLALTGWNLAAWLSLVLAAAAGLLGWGAVILFFNKVLLRGEKRLDPDDYRLEGTVAQVTVAIGSGRIGEVQYSLAGTRRSEGARSVDGSKIERGAEVVIVRYERGIAYVEPWQTFVEESAPLAG